MPVVDDSIVISRPRSDVWEAMTDPATVLLTNSNLDEFEQVTDGPVSTGTRYRGVVRVAGKRIEWISEVTEIEPEERLIQRSIEAAIPFSLEFRCEDADGGTRVVWHQEADSYGGFFGKLTDPIVTRMYAKDVRSNLEKLKELLESEE